MTEPEIFAFWTRIACELIVGAVIVAVALALRAWGG